MIFCKLYVLTLEFYFSNPSSKKVNVLKKLHPKLLAKRQKTILTHTGVQNAELRHFIRTLIFSKNKSIKKISHFQTKVHPIKTESENLESRN